MAFGLAWLHAPLFAILGYQLFILIRLKQVLGIMTWRVTSSNARLWFTGIASVILILVCIVKALLVPGGETDEWVREYYRHSLNQHFFLTLSVVSSFLFSLMDRQVREEGVYFGGMYTWEQLQGYQVKGSVIRIWTTKIALFSGKLRVLKFKIPDFEVMHELIKIMEYNGVNEYKSDAS